MSFEELLQEHIKALNENTKALVALANTKGSEAAGHVAVEHTKYSACQFCGISYKTMQNYIDEGSLIPCRRKSGKREYFMEKDLVTLCETKKLFGGEYGLMKNNPRSQYYA